MEHPSVDASLLSGGVDSFALAAWKKPSHLLTIDYGQVTAASEIIAATRISEVLAIPHQIIQVDLRAVGSGTLCGDSPLESAPHDDWWPFRNQQLISIAGAWAVKKNVKTILIGSVRSDSCFKDGTYEFYKAMNQLMGIQEGGIVVEAPAIEMTTMELVEQSALDTNLLALCFSCNRSVKSCGRCRGCTKFRGVAEHFGLLLG